MKKLLPLIAGALFLGCDSKPIHKDEVLAPPIVRAEPKRVEFHEVLRDYIYGLYDQSLGLPSPGFSTAKNTLEECLRAARLSPIDSRLLFQGDRVPDLENYFISQGLIFRNFNAPGTQLSYELVRLSPAESKELELFGTKKAYKKVNVTEILIQNAYDHEAELNRSKSGRVASAHKFLSGMIESRPGRYDAQARSYFDGISLLKSGLDEDLKDPSRLDSYEGDKLYDRLGKLFHYLAVRDDFNSSDSFEDFRRKVAPKWIRDSDFHEVMHLIDKEHGSIVVDSLNEAGKKKFAEAEYVNLEARAMLAELHYGSGFNNMGHLFAMLIGDEPGSMDEHQKAARMVLYALTIDLKKDFESEHSVYKRMLGLSEEDIHRLSKKAFDMLYEGKSFEQYMRGVAVQILRDQRRRR